MISFPPGPGWVCLGVILINQLSGCRLPARWPGCVASFLPCCLVSACLRVGLAKLFLLLSSYVMAHAIARARVVVHVVTWMCLCVWLGCLLSSSVLSVVVVPCCLFPHWLVRLPSVLLDPRRSVPSPLGAFTWTPLV